MKAKKATQQKCTVKILEAMVNNTQKNYSSLHFFTRQVRRKKARVEVVWNSSAADSFLERMDEPLEWMTIFFDQITRAL